MEEEEIKIKTLCEYLFFDEYQDTATFPRFEKCFQPLFNNIPISIETVFKNICGERKKYINYNRFAKAYLNHLNNQDPSNDTKVFFNTLLTKILKVEKTFIGNPIENGYSFSTAKSCKNRQCLSLIEVLSDKKGKIHGINLEYDEVFKSKMYPTRIGDDLLVNLEMKLGIVDEKPLKENLVGKFLGYQQGNYRDAVTHIFGTYNEQSNLITFLGFKCISGKTVFVGFPEGDGFLFGKFGKKFHDIKLQMTDEGINKFEPGFKPNPRTNYFLEKIVGNLTSQELNTDELIKDEKELENITNEVELDKLITIPILEEDHFFNDKLKDEIAGNDYKEVVNQYPRNWILRSKPPKINQTPEKKTVSLMESLRIFDQEQELRAPSKLRANKFRAKKKILLPQHKGGDDPMLRSQASGPINFHHINNPSMGRTEPWLHKTKIFKPRPRYGINESNNRKLRSKKNLPWNGKIEKKMNPTIFLSKRNYVGLKQKLGKLIHDEVEKQTEGNEEMKTALLSQIIPNPGTDNVRLRGKRVLPGKSARKRHFKLRMKNLKGETNIFGQEKKTSSILRDKPSKSTDKIDQKDKDEENMVYSDALQILNDMSDKKEEKKEQNNADNYFGFVSSNYSDNKRNQYFNPFAGGYGNYHYNNNYGYGKLRGYNNNLGGYNNYNNFNNYNNYNNFGPQRVIPAYNQNNNFPQTIPPAMPQTIPAYGKQNNQPQNMNNQFQPPQYNNYYNNYNNNYNNMYNNNYNNYNNFDNRGYNNNYNNYPQGPYGPYNNYGPPHQFGPPNYGPNQNPNIEPQYNKSNTFNPPEQFPPKQIPSNYNSVLPPQMPKEEKKEEPKEEPIDPEKYKKAQEKWKKFREGVEKMNGIYLLQTMGSIIKAMRILGNDNEESEKISLAEKVKLYKLIEENEAIVDFLSQSDNKPEEKNENQIDIGGEGTEEDNLLIPDEHPEQFTSLDELQKKLEDMKKLLEKKLKDEDRKKIEQLYNLYLQQKNILIENETKNAKKEVIEQNKIDVNKYIQEEKEKRKKAEEEEQKKMEQKRKEEEAKRKMEEKVNSILNKKVSTKIYRDQKMPENDQPWTDDIFPPEKQSLCPYNNRGWVLPPEVWDSDVEGWETLKWCRAEEIFDSKDYTVFKDGSSMDDIVQGNLGDCYFLSALGSLCAYPDFFNKLFHTKEKTKEHVYGIYIYINGKWELILVDDYFPYQGSRFKQFVFGASGQNELWVSLIEKAWAKVNGCYAKIACGGEPNEVFDVLTEAFSEKHSINKTTKENIWKILEEGQGKGYVMTAGTSGDVNNLDIEEMGLSPAHAYTFLKTYNVNTDKGIERVVKLRNPWGNGEWSGAWSDSSKKWNQNTKKQCEYQQDRDDGVFYMSFDDFVKYYVTMGIVKLQHNYQTTVCKIPKAKAIKCQVLLLTVKEPNEKSYIQLYQKNPRIILKDGTYQNTALSYMILLDKDFKYIKSISNNNMHLGIETDLNPGIYYLLCDVNYRYVNENGKNRGYKVTCYSKNPILIENVTERIDSSKTLEVCMYYYCKEKVQPIKHKTGMDIYISKNYNSEIPFLVACFVNNSPQNYKIKLEMKPKGEKSFCIYNDSIATENDVQVIKEIKSGSVKVVSIMKYSLSSMFSLSYAVLSSDDVRTTETINPVFEEEGEQIDEQGYLFQYVKEVDGGDGYTVGLENTSDYKIKLKLVLEGMTILDSEFKGKDSAQFMSMPRSKKVFNLKIKPDADDLTFEFVYA